MSNQHDPLIGRTLGQYQILDVIGKGGMATVYRGFQRSIDREVAIKVLSPELASDERLLARFEREARMVASLQHPNILTVHDFGREGDILYLVLRLMSGGSLLDELQQRGPLPTERALSLIKQIADALDYAHARGIVHRDLKPSNVLLDQDGNVSLTDFGIAKMIQGGQTTGLTAANSMMGTPIYMAPEQWRSEPVTARTDVYALGVMAYWMLVGQVPFSAETPHGLMYQHLNEAPEAPHLLNPNVPRSVEMVLDHALAKRPEDRYASAGAFAAALEAAFRAPTRPVASPAAGTRRDDTIEREVIPPQYTQPNAAQPYPQNQYPANMRANEPSGWNTAQQQTYQQPRYGERRSDALPRYSEQYSEQYGEPYQPDEPRATATPHTSTGYTPPYTANDYASGRRADYARQAVYDNDPGIGRFFWVVGGVTIVVVIVFVIVLVISLLTTQGSKKSSQAGPDAPTTGATTVPDSLRPSVVIQQPQDNSSINLGQTLRIEFIASSESGITEVQLRRFNQVIDSVQVSSAVRYQGLFTYTPDSTGPHVLEVIAWSDRIAGEPARITIFVQ